MNTNKLIECPCCENESKHSKWYEISNDYQLLCPVCDNTVQYDEFEKGTF